jgi:hypothetical protein
MIKLEKTDTPPVLTASSARWTDELLRQIAEGDVTDAVRYRYRDAGIRAALVLETSGKCAYCESLMMAVSFAHIEHIVPRARKPELSFEWPNLTLVCEQCNNNKRDYYDENAPVVNPYTEEPSEHLLFVGPLVTHLTEQPGLLTIHVLDLNRGTLLDRRREKIEQLLALIDRWIRMPAGGLKNFLWAEIESFAAPTAELSATATSFLRARGF